MENFEQSGFTYDDLGEKSLDYPNPLIGSDIELENTDPEEETALIEKDLHNALGKDGVEIVEFVPYFTDGEVPELRQK